MVIVFIGSAIQLVFDKVIFNKTVLGIAIINILASCFFIFNGILQSAPGALSVSSVYVIWPILFLYFTGLNYRFLELKPFITTILIGGLISSVLVVLFIINEFFGIPGVSVLADAQDYMGGFFEGFIQLQTNNLTTVFYVFTFSLTIFSLPKSLNPFYSGKKKWLVLASLITSLLIIIVSGRRAFWLMCLLCPLIIAILFSLSKVKIKFASYLFPIIFMFIVIIAAFQVFSLNTDFIVNRIESSFEFNDPGSESNYIRKEQSDALLNGWKDHPIFGAGLGATAKGSVRDPEAPWSYELSYWALLFQTGIVGIMIYASSVFWIFIKSINIMRHDRSSVFLFAPQLVGLITFLIINSSNPYLAKFDYLWTIFFPVATLNAYLVSKPSDEKTNVI